MMTTKEGLDRFDVDGRSGIPIPPPWLLSLIGSALLSSLRRRAFPFHHSCSIGGDGNKRGENVDVDVGDVWWTVDTCEKNKYEFVFSFENKRSQGVEKWCQR